MCREWEGDCLWGYFGWNSDNVMHVRLGFYKGDIFTQEPTMERDVWPVFELIRKINPDIITVALDPEASGPDTHYKVLQTITEAIKMFEKESSRSNLEILGYRNVWYRFHPSEAEIFVPVSLAESMASSTFFPVFSMSPSFSQPIVANATNDDRIPKKRIILNFFTAHLLSMFAPGRKLQQLKHEPPTKIPHWN